VQSDKPWKPEAVLLLAAGLMICLSAGMLITLVARTFWPDFTPAQQTFQNFLVNGLSFQMGGLMLTHFFLKIHDVTWAEFLGLKSGNLPRAIAIAVAVIVVALPLTLGLNEASRIVITYVSGTPATQPTIQVLEASVSLGQRICFGIAAIALAPAVEEILFRGILYRAIKQRGYPKIALFGSALLFGAIHASLMTFFPLTILAIIFALLYDKADNLMAPIVAHSLFNAANFFFFIYQRELERWWKQF
jgi:membrane protease YdiL (CAAX protease family)